MTDYYVSPSGSNANDGLSALTPWLTLAKAQSSTSTGDRIYHLSGGVWNDESYFFLTARTLGVYNGASRWVMDYNGSDGGDNHAMIYFDGGSGTVISDAEIRNDTSGSSTSTSGRGISFRSGSATINNVYVHDMGGTGIVRSFQGDNPTLTDCIVEQVEQNWFTFGGIWGGGISFAGASNPVDGCSVSNCQVFECVGEGISCYANNNATECTDIDWFDNDLYACRAAGFYINGVHGAVVKRNIVTGTTDTDYHRTPDITGYSGYGMLQSVEADFADDGDLFNANMWNDDIHWYNNLVAFTAYGIKMASWFSQNQETTNTLIEHNTFISNAFNVGTENDFGAGNTYRQNASLLIGSEGAGASPAHTEGTDGGDFTLSENFWEGGGEDPSWNDASDFSNAAWLPAKTSGWQSLASSSAVTLDDWRPDTEVEGAQLTNPETGSAYTDYEGIMNFREAGALANDDVVAGGGTTSFQRQQNLATGFGPHRSRRLGGEIEQ